MAQARKRRGIPWNWTILSCRTIYLLTIYGVRFSVNNDTHISGNPHIGSSAVVVALEDDDDALEVVAVDAQGSQAVENEGGDYPDSIRQFGFGIFRPGSFI